MDNKNYALFKTPAKVTNFGLICKHTTTFLVGLRQFFNKIPGVGFRMQSFRKLSWLRWSRGQRLLPEQNYRRVQTDAGKPL